MTVLPIKLFDECANEPAKPWLIKGVLALDEDSSWYGPAGSLKSALLTDISVTLAAQRKDWRGFAVKRAAGVVYFAFERAALTRRRLAAYAKRDGHKSLPIAVADQIVDLIDSGCVETIVDTIRAAEASFGVAVGLIILDTWGKGVAAGGADEDKAQHVNVVAANLKRVHEALDHPIHIASIGHTGKDETRGERGSSAKGGHIDLGIQIAGDGAVKTLTVTKGNDQAEGVLTAFSGEEIVIGTDEDGDSLTAFIVSRATVQAAPAGHSRLSDRQVRAMDALKTAIKAHGQRGAVAIDAWREEIFRTGVLDREAKNPRQDFRRIRDALARLQRIVEQDGMVRIGQSIASPPIFPAAGGNNLIAMPPMPLPRVAT